MKDISFIPDRSSLIHRIESYVPGDAEELAFRMRFLKLLDHPRSFFRDHLPGHITASSWIIDSSKTFALLTHHAKLNRWLQPGGHADGDEDTLAVAHREASEETGLRSLRSISPAIFDLDIHPIPERGEFPRHDHYDIRYLFEADKTEPLIISDESHDLAWIPLAQLAKKTAGNKSILRMSEKIRGLS
jgi:8-oxo-dGTP pyrophosphatase MutT (NUDIX family)